MSAAIAAAAAGARCYPRSSKRSSSNSVTENSYGGGTPNQQSYLYATTTTAQPSNNRYESLKQRDWNTFGQYRKTYNPPLTLSKCGSEHVLEFLRNLGETNQASGSLDGLIGRLRVAFEENGGRPETNPFGARDVRLYLSQLRDSQAKARGIAYDQK